MHFVCVRQGVAFRGHANESLASMSMLEIFLKFRVQTDVILADHLKNAPRNATYLSKRIQNELIHIACDHLRCGIISEIKTAKYFTLLADEVTDSSNGNSCLLHPI